MNATTESIVVKLGGALLDNEDCLAKVVGALASAVAGSIVIVHGGGLAIDRQLAALGMPTTRRDGIRITPPEQAVQIAGVLGGQVNTQLVAQLNRHGARAVGLRLTDGGLATLALIDNLPFDAGCVGQVTGGNPEIIDVLRDHGFMPVISSAGTSPDGAVLNVNADDAAAAIARIVAASALVFLTDVPGVLDSEGQTISEIDQAAFAALVANGTISGGMIPKVRSALETATTTGVPVVITSWRERDSLAGLASGNIKGTQIS